jgi:hypothetical protein
MARIMHIDRRRTIFGNMKMQCSVVLPADRGARATPRCVRPA